MSTQGRSTYQATLDTASYFQDNTSELITEAKIRGSLTNLSDSTLFKKDDPFLRIVTATTGTEPAYVITLTNLYSGSYSQLMPILFNAHATNTGAATINVNSLGAKSLKRPDGTATQAGDIVSGQLYIINYDGTDFLIVPGFGGGTAFNLVTGGTDNAIIRADGTGGSTTQGSSATIDDAGNIDILGTATIGSFTGTADALTGSTSGGVLTDVTIGTGLSLSSGTLSSTVAGSVTSFSPTIYDAPSSGNMASVGSTNAYYVQNGKALHFSISFGNITTAGMTGANGIYIRGLPVAANSSFGSFTFSVMGDAITFPGAASGYMNSGGSTYFSLVEQSDWSTEIPVSVITSGSGDLIITGTYFTD